MKNNTADQSNILAKKAWKELDESGKTSVVCPKCGKSPEKIVNGNRIKISCPCKYIVDFEIYF